MRRLSLPTPITALACALLCQFASAEPQLQAWLDQRPLPLQRSGPMPLPTTAPAPSVHFTPQYDPR